MRRCANFQEAKYLPRIPSIFDMLWGPGVKCHGRVSTTKRSQKVQEHKQQQIRQVTGDWRGDRKVCALAPQIWRIRAAHSTRGMPTERGRGWRRSKQIPRYILLGSQLGRCCMHVIHEHYALHLPRCLHQNLLAQRFDSFVLYDSGQQQAFDSL